MRRKSERTASKKVKASPEKKVEKVKRTRSSRRRKQSETSENESAEETSSPVREVVPPPEVEKTPVKAKDESPEESQDQVWQVKTAQTSKESGEIGKLKLCLSRPPSTPERVDRSPRSKRKHSRATSSSDTPSSEGVEEKKKGRERVKRSRESKDDIEYGHDTSHESQGDDAVEAEPVNTVSQSSEAQSKEDETPVSTTDESNKADEKVAPNKEQSQNKQSNKPEPSSSDNNKASDADTTVQSPLKEEPVSSNETSAATEEQPKTPVRERSASVDKSEVLEIHANESKIESSEGGDIQQEENKSVGKESDQPEQKKQSSPEKEKVSITMDSSKKCVSKEDVPREVESTDITNKNNVVEGSESVETSGKSSINLDKSKSEQKKDEDSETTKSTHEEPIPNGQAAPFVINRKRKWGARPRLNSQKSITISSDVLKEIIPDVKPVEFDEVIEEKKHKRIEVTEKFDRPVLPKIIIDNTENVEKQKKDQEDRDKENEKKFEPQIGANRKISILNDNDSIITRPPSPPRHKQSCILYITNLVRPFTLLQLKNLLQRTGRIVEDGFWIDRIKSKCFVKYETEDQAVETRHALHGVTWPVSNPKTLQVDFSTDEAFEKTRSNENADTAPVSNIPGTVEDWLREQDQKKERGETEKPWERKAAVREWDVGKNEKDKEMEKLNRDNRLGDKRRHRSPERSPEPARKFKKKEEEAPAKLLDDLFRKTKTTPCIYWLPLSAETIAVKEEQRRQHMLEHERRMQELRRRRH